MFKNISSLTSNELKYVPDITNVETEARMGKFDKTGKFLPGVSKEYFYDMKNVLNRLVPFYKHKKTKSIAIYFNDGLRAECFSDGRIVCIRKKKITNDIDMNIPCHYSLRISTSKEEPLDEPVLKASVKKFLKPKTLPRLLREGTLMKLHKGACLLYKGKMYTCHQQPLCGFEDLIWRIANPDILIRLDRARIKLRETKYTPNDWVDMVSLAGTFKGRPSYMAEFTIKVHIRALVPLTNLSNVQGIPPYVPTSWRSKKRISYNLWDGMNIDMTETIYSNRSIQACYDGTGKTTYEVEADWNLKHKTTKEFSEVIKHVLYSK